MAKKKQPSFWSVENYLWFAMFDAPPNTDLRNWYVDGWWELVRLRGQLGLGFSPYFRK